VPRPLGAELEAPAAVAGRWGLRVRLPARRCSALALSRPGWTRPVTAQAVQTADRARRNQLPPSLRCPWSGLGSEAILRHGSPRHGACWSDLADRVDDSCLQTAPGSSQQPV